MKATFFCIGDQIVNEKDGREILERMKEEGHELGNHAWFDEASYQLPLREYESQTEQVENLLPPLSPGQKRLLRPGGGLFSKQMREMIQRKGYLLALGDVYPHDPQLPFPKINARFVLGHVHPGAIVILHDRREYSVEEVELVLKGLEEGAWELVTVSRLLEIEKEERGLAR